jgi:hypothetical protein
VQGHLLLVEGQSASKVVAWLEGLGFGVPIASTRDVPAAEIWPRVEAAQAARPDGPITGFAVTQSGRWTVVSDLDAVLVENEDLAVDLSADTGERVIALALDERTPSMVCHHGGATVRRLEQRPNGLVAEGERSALEELFASPIRLEQNDLLGFLQALGIDVTRLNVDASYALLLFPG